MNAFGFLIIILFLLLVFVCVFQGFNAFVGLVFLFIVLFLLMLFLTWHFNAYIVSSLLCFFILSFALSFCAEN